MLRKEDIYPLIFQYYNKAKVVLIDDKRNRNILVAVTLIAITALLVITLKGEKEHKLPDGTIYVGEWDDKNECPNGVGYVVTFDKNGESDTIRGFFDEGNLVEVYNKKDFDGLVDVASYSANESNYQARTYHNGERYLGFFKDGKRHGDLGLCIKPDGTMQFGRWDNDECKSNPPFPIENYVYGIDASHYQDLDWDQFCFRTDGSAHLLGKKDKHYEVLPVLFVMVKATQGTTYVDKTLKNLYHEASRHRIIRGAYHYLSQESPVEEQVNHYLESVGTFYTADLPPILDVEHNPKQGNTDSRKLIQVALKWLTIVEQKTHCCPILYINENLYRAQILDKGLYSKFKKYPLWIANYNSRPSENIHWTFWQFTDKGFVNGQLNGNAMDINRFNGNYKQLEDFIRKYGFKEKWSAD